MIATVTGVSNRMNESNQNAALRKSCNPPILTTKLFIQNIVPLVRIIFNAELRECVFRGRQSSYTYHTQQSCNTRLASSYKHRFPK